jgi:hypothetical protein
LLRVWFLLRKKSLSVLVLIEREIEHFLFSNVMEYLRKTRSFHPEEERRGVASNDSSSVRMDYP